MALKSNVLPSEGSIRKMVQVRPDAIICQIDQLKWGVSMGFGEVKLSEPACNADVSGQDLIRLSILGKNTLMEAEMKTSISFQIHGMSSVILLSILQCSVLKLFIYASYLTYLPTGYKLNVFVSKMIPDTRIVAMVEIESITFPKFNGRIAYHHQPNRIK